MSCCDLDSNVARVCTNKARLCSIKQGLSRFKHDLQNDFIRLLYGSLYGLLRPSTIKDDFYSNNLTFTGFAYGPTDYCSSYSRIITHSCMFLHKIDSFWLGFTNFRTSYRESIKMACAVVYTVSHGLSRSCTIANTIIHGHGTRVSFF